MAGRAKGSEFVVRLPLLPRADIPNGSATAKSSPADGAPRRILIVDDDRDAARTLQLMLARKGHDVRSVFHGDDVLSTAREFRPDVILLDIELPDVDGYEGARWVRGTAELDGTLLIATTGYGTDEDIRQARAAGFDEHLAKPVALDRLQATVARGRA